MQHLPKFIKDLDWKYSIREIVLIVIGILVALGLNNWKENQQLKNEETEILQELVMSLQNDLKDIRINLEIHEKSYESTLLLIDHLKQGKSYSDTLDAHFGMALGSSFFLSDNVAYNTLEKKGRQLITDINIRSELSTLYAHDYAFIKELEEIDRDNLLFNLQPYYTENFKEFILFQTATPINYEDLRNDFDYLGKLEWVRDNRKYTVARYGLIKNRVEDLVLVIEQEIEKK